VRGFAADVINFIVNLFLVVPALPLMIVIAAYLQNGGIGMIVLVVVITGWAWGARVLRSQTQSLRSRDFVTAAVFSGESPARIVFREILPNMTSLIVGSFFGASTAAILAEAGLEFLGLGDSTTVSWGTMLFWAQNSNALLTGQWVLLFAPGLCISLLATSMSLINFGVDGLSNPRLREGSKR
jgi:peptide/nickel transport system permease protein